MVINKNYKRQFRSIEDSQQREASVCRCVCVCVQQKPIRKSITKIIFDCSFVCALYVQKKNRYYDLAPMAVVRWCVGSSRQLAGERQQPSLNVIDLIIIIVLICHETARRVRALAPTNMYACITGAGSAVWIIILGNNFIRAETGAQKLWNSVEMLSIISKQKTNDSKSKRIIRFCSPRSIWMNGERVSISYWILIWIHSVSSASGLIWTSSGNTCICATLCGACTRLWKLRLAWLRVNSWPVAKMTQKSGCRTDWWSI